MRCHAYLSPLSLSQLEAPSEMISISPKETTLNAGENLNLFCQPSDSSLGVWWTAKDANGNNIDVIYGFDRVAVSKPTAESSYF